MKISKIVSVVIAVVAGIYLVSRLFDSGPDQRDEEFVTAKLPQIQAALNNDLTYRDGVCVYGDSYSINPRLYKASGPFAPASDPDDIYRPTCKRCEDLVEAGLLEQIANNTKSVTGATAHYELTELGKSAYTEDVKPTQFEDELRVNWKFCFGRTAFYKIEEALPPRPFAERIVIDVKYIAQVIDPHPFLFDPKSKSLGLAVPTNSSPALYPARIAGIIFQPDGHVDVDNSFRYGKYLNEK